MNDNRQSPPLSVELLLKGYKVMLLTRLVDERMITLQRQGAIFFALSSRGEEACAVATAAALLPEDWIYPQYRELGAMFWRGYSVQEYLHHMFGDAKDPSLGRQMANHFGSRALNVVTVSSPIGTKIPHAAGCAYAMKLQKEPTVALCFFGEGAASQGDFHAGLNFASVRKAPAIFFCRNNGYAISTPTNRQFACRQIVDRALGYGMLGLSVDGNDFFAVYHAVQQARQHCIDGHGPVLIEAMTYRLGAHSTSDDPSVYRSEEEVKAKEKECPILRLREYLTKEHVWDDRQENKFIDEVQTQISQAIEIAKETARAPLSFLFEHVYFETPDNLKTQCDQVCRLFPE